MDERLQQAIQEQQLTSVMNNTKWQECIHILRNVGDHGPRCSIHYLLDPQSPYSFSYISWDELAREVVYIYWMDIEMSSAENISKKLHEYHIPHTVQAEGVLRVWGYYRSGDYPNFL